VLSCTQWSSVRHQRPSARLAVQVQARQSAVGAEDARQKASAYARDPLPAIVERDHLWENQQWQTSVQKGQLICGEPDHQRLSEVIRGYQRSSEVIRGALRGHQRGTQRSLSVHQREHQREHQRPIRGRNQNAITSSSSTSASINRKPTRPHELRSSELPNSEMPSSLIRFERKSIYGGV
jgi:hypothetical protein